MRGTLPILSAGLACLATLPAQQLSWQVPVSGPSTTEYQWMAPFADYDHDGYRDFLRFVMTSVTGSNLWLQITSGQDGSTLWELNYSAIRARHAGDIDGDGYPDLLILVPFSWTLRQVQAYSPRKGAVLWGATGSLSAEFGDNILGDIDVDGDGRPDVLATTASSAASDVYVYDHRGQLRYLVPCRSQNRIAESLCNMGDMDGDGCDDFLIGCHEGSGRGMQWLVSGQTGSTIRETYGLLFGDYTSEHVSNLGDIDGDGVNDYAAFPYWSAQRAIAVAYSGATGAVIRSWTDGPNSVVAGEDFDQDGINDIVTGGDWVVSSPNVYGRTLCFSGRDGSELWRVDNLPHVPGSPVNPGTSAWMESSASLGVQPGSPYPVLAWMEVLWFSTAIGGGGRIRAYGGTRAGQGPVSGEACTSSGLLPLIGVRKLGTGAQNTGSRLTVARTHANALAAVNLNFAALPSPVDLSPFGFSGCAVYVDPIASAVRVTGTTGIDRGYAAVDLPHPLSATAIGTQVVAQWLVFDATTGSYAATQMHALRLQ